MFILIRLPSPEPFGGRLLNKWLSVVVNQKGCCEIVCASISVTYSSASGTSGTAWRHQTLIIFAGVIQLRRLWHYQTLIVAAALLAALAYNPQ